MHWQDASIVLSSRKYGETSAIVRVLAREHGVYAGVMRGANSKNNRGIVQVGNVVGVSWNARLSEQLGTFKLELMEAHAAHLMMDAAKLSALSSACALLELALPERHPYPKLFASFHEFLHTLVASSDWWVDYIKLELEILSECGFGLDLSECAATGVTTDLIYVSPKSGRAVSREAGEPYKDKLLPLPDFLLKEKSPLPKDGGVMDGVEIPSPVYGGGLGRGDKHLTEYARSLRTNQTEAEKIIWYHLRAHRFEGYGFRRQYPIKDKYIADFVCLEKCLIIEIDGGQHTEQLAEDKVRTEFLEAEGYRVLRFWNNEVMENIEGVLTVISKQLNTPSNLSSPSLTLPHKWERESSSPQSLVPSPHLKQILAGMTLTGYFLEHSLLAPHGKKLPAARTRLCNLIMNNQHQ